MRLDGRKTNIVVNSKGQFIEVQFTAESKPFSCTMLDNLLNLAYKGIGKLLTIPKAILDE
jgi:ribonuclease PH